MNAKTLTWTLALAALTLAGCASRPKPLATADAPQAEYQGADRSVADQRSSTAAPALESGRSASLDEIQARFAQSAGDRVYFDLDSHILSAAARDALSRQADWLRQNPGVRILVAGNCDERGTREYNFALGARRAEAASAYLISQGVSPGRIDRVSYGKERPIELGVTEDAWSKNRNAHTVIVDLGPR